MYSDSVSRSVLKPAHLCWRRRKRDIELSMVEKTMLLRGA
jgi:hypothetical protein